MKNYFKNLRNKILKRLQTVFKKFPNKSHNQKFSEKLNDFCIYQKQVRSNLVHDIRNPLLNIKLSLEVHKNLIKKIRNSNQDIPDDIISSFEKHYKMMNRDIRQIDFYIDQTLKLEQNPLDEFNLKFTPINLKKELQMLLHKFQNIYADDDRDFHFNGTINSKTVQIDKEKLNRMIINLLSNAIKYTPKGSITLNLLEDDFNIFISVKDTGYGIPSDKIDEILMRFKRAESPYQQQGSGIGLSIVNHIAKLHGGEILIESKEEKGSCFTIRLPKNILIKNQTE